jgi:ankyrin repeat protein
MNALIFEIRQIKPLCSGCRNLQMEPHRTHVNHVNHHNSVPTSEYGTTLARSTASRKFSTSLLPAVIGLEASVIVTNTVHDRRYVLSLHVRVLSKMVVSIDLTIRLRSWGSLSLTRSSLTWRNFVKEDSDFMTAAARGDTVSMQRLLTERRANPFEVCDGNITALTLAIESGVADAVRLLLDCEVDVNDVFGFKQTSPLAWALKVRALDVARLLVERGASFHHLSIWGWSPLFYLWSRTFRHPSSTEYLQLLRSKYDFSWLHQSLMDDEGWGLMHRAAIFGTPEDVLMLMRFGVDPYQTIGNFGWTVLHNVVHYGIVDVFLALAPYYEHMGFDLPDLRGWTLLHIAAAEGHDQIIHHLLLRGANADANDEDYLG